MTTALNGHRPILGGQSETPAVGAAGASGGRVSGPDSTPSQDSTGQGPLDALRTYTTMLSPVRADFIRLHQMWGKQRVLRPSHVAYLVSAIERGEMTTVSLIFAELPNRDRILVDGQHRLNAIVQAGVTLPCSVTVHRVPNEESIGKLYLTIDRQTTRDSRDGLRALGIEERTKLSPTVLNHISRGVIIVDSNFSRSYRKEAKSLILRTQAVERWLPAGEHYAELLRGATQEVSGMLWRAPVCAVALATIRYDSLAEEFWGRMAMEDGLGRNDPRARLLAWLRNNRVAQVGNDIIYARHVAGAWNAFHEGRTLERLQIKDPTAPVRILGTPYGRDGASE